MRVLPVASPVPAPDLRRYRTPLLVVAALAGAVFLLRRTVFAPKAVPVQVATVTRGAVEQTVANSRAGTVKARRRAKLSPQEGGRVVALPKRKGDRVRAGDMLLELDASVQRARLDLARRERDAAAAEQARTCLVADRAARELARNRGLAKQGIVSTDLLDQVESGARSAAAACTAAKANAARAAAGVELAERQLAYTTIRAPFDGVIADLSIEVGEWSTPSPPVIQVPPVIDVIDTVVDLRQRADGRGRFGAPSRRGRPRGSPSTRTRASASPDTSCASAPTCSTSRSRTGPSRSRSSSTTRPSRRRCCPARRPTSRWSSRRAPTCSASPRRRCSRATSVLVVDGRTLVERPVEVGLRNWDETEVRSGLAEGDRVVVSLDRAEVKAGVAVDGRVEPRAVIRLEHVSRVFRVGETEVRALDDVTEHVAARRARRDHGSVGLRQVDAPQRRRLPRPADVADATSSTAAR